MALRATVGLGLWAAIALGCGARTATVDDEPDATTRPEAQAEQCNGLDDDLDGEVDEPFRDDAGRYLHDDHCGRCGAACRVPGPNALTVACEVIDEAPLCAATLCAAGFVVSRSGGCVPAFDHLCLACIDDGDCGEARSARCADLGSESRCVVGCEGGCPDGYRCDGDRCVPEGGSCSCDPGDRFSLACAILLEDDVRCIGAAVCDDGSLSLCAPGVEVCDHVDNDCNGVIDDGFRDEREAYSLDVRNCGECGVDCTLSVAPEGDLVCGGDPFAPTCVLACPDAADGIQPGDRIDGDLNIATGCECTVSALSDEAGPPGASGEGLDVNCDGADGMVVQSFYVAVDGDDGGPGSPTRPLATIGEALRRSAESLELDAPRPHVFVASGAYTESLILPDGVQLHGGYRRDFLGLDPDGFRVEVRAPADTTAPGGAALEARDAGRQLTLVEWVSLSGLDARAEGGAAFGIYLESPGANLVLRSLQVRSGNAGAGRSGMAGEAGAGPDSGGGVGSPPRAAREDGSHRCSVGVDNEVAGGAGGANRCGDVDVSGGVGGQARCPSFGVSQASGGAGRAPAAASAASGGAGGMDSQGPISGTSCPAEVCCGLADFSVPTEFTGPQAGRNGPDGASGTPGRGCRDAFGRFDGDRWTGEDGTPGTGAAPGGGGGGGGAGGGTEMDWTAGVCEFPDGLGGGGGGGGGGGCGGAAGRAGTSGAPSVAVLIRASSSSSLPTLRDVLLRPGDGGRGGAGGAGGDGGLGGTGGFGGELERAARATPTLAGPFPGGRGGKGGNGGPGGGGGAGCGGGSVGVWVTGIGAGEPSVVSGWRESNVFELGRGGAAGRGGGGEAAAADGAAGGQVDVIVR